MSAPRSEWAAEPRRLRLHSAYDPELYRRPYVHDRWPDHIQRIRATIDFGWIMVPLVPRTIADLSCGDGAIARGLAERYAAEYGEVVPRPRLTLGDVTEGWTVRGPIERTIREIDRVDLLICSETVEHLDDPDAVLRDAAGVADWILLTTPVAEWDGASNPEHLWGWNVAAVRELLGSTGWHPIASIVYTPSAVDFYTFQFWVAHS